ncbi:translocation/assembly module TamB domain-containing protein [Aquabacterium sp. OR-4]|uniref:translocation/assembly module TamB domain-containing protein n=1 Tax=Aquabacterium sp. OR-4 TaxID=2978127 RepID=UPI0028C9F052|nr:translocation/assembly module TamB domain-containing protein [Aquabacterium sp. OR-4]MDT7835822.1 translocation/assembly module TamB domain-containing protein [Aquabacterium sp. OR-4]
MNTPPDPAASAAAPVLPPTVPAPAPAPAPEAATAQAPAPRRRWLAITLASLAVLLAGLVGSGAWWWQRPASLPWLLAQVPGLQVQGVHGTPGTATWRIDRLDWTLPGQAGTLHIQQLVLRRDTLTWQPHAGAWVGLRLGEVSAAQLHYRSGPPSTTPITAPTQLALPLVLQIDRLQIGSLQIDAQPPLQQVQARLHLGAGAGARHRLELQSATLEQLHLSGQAQIDSAAPLNTRLQLAAQGATRGPGGHNLPWQARAEATGPLARLALTLQLQGAATEPATAAAQAAHPPPRLQARATVTPFAAWPLAALQFETQALDLAALSPRLPGTHLNGQATVASDGLDRPARLQLRLDNQRPAAWHLGGLPLRSLQAEASATPRQPDRLALSRFTLQLADAQGAAGQLSGQGHWQGAQAHLDLQLDDVAPARLDQRAAPMRLSGPLSLTLSGLGQAGATPSVSFDTRLTGRLQAGRLPAGTATAEVQLRAVGEASASHLLLREAALRSGPTSAQATLNLRSEPRGWRVQGSGRLDGFDPLPWWPGTPGSVWQRGPHRLAGRLEADLLWPTSTAAATGTTTRATPQAARSGAAPSAASGTPPAELLARLPALQGRAALTLADSLLAGVPLAGQLTLDGNTARPQLDASLTAAGNRLALRWQSGATPTDDQARLDWQGPQLAALAPWGAWLAEAWPASAGLWPRAGSLHGSLQLRGRWPALQATEGQWQADALATRAATLQSGQLSWRSGADIDAPLQLQLQLRQLAAGAQRLERLEARADGSLREHTLRLQADSPVRPPAWTEPLIGSPGTGTRIELESRGRWLPEADGGVRWQAQAVRLRGAARPAHAAPGSASAATATANSAAGARTWLDAQWPLAELRLDRGLRPLAFDAGPGRVQLASTGLQWQQLRWQAAGAGTRHPEGLWELRGTLDTIDVASLLQKLQPEIGWSGQLTLGGRVEIRLAEQLDADIVLERGGGDLTITDELGQSQSLGLSELRLALSAHDGLWQFAQGLAGRSIGAMAGAQVLRTDPRLRWPGRDATLQGVLEAQVANLGAWGTWVPPGWRLAGQLHTSASFGGTLGAPQVNGRMSGSGIAVRHLLQGIQLQDGELAITLDGDKARIERLQFKGGEGGTLALSGQATLGATPAATLDLVAERFRLIGRVDRRLLTSGRAQARLDAEQLAVEGDFRIDEGLFDISRGEAPALDDDVRVHRGGDTVAAPTSASTSASTGAPTSAPTTATAPEAATAGSRAAAVPASLRQTRLALRVDLGERLRLRGRGIDTGLRGKLQISSPGGRLALNGTVRAEGGQYAAYGQKLDIRRGEVRFSGALDNPAIDVQAIRPNLDVLVGVSLTGTAQAPRIRLFSEPDLSDYEKLSWLVLGRSSDGLGRTDTALLQRAALALLSGDGQAPTDTLLDTLGLTDFSVRQTEGDVRDTVISLGKQLSRRWYLGYERSVNSTAGTWQLIYRIAQRFTLRAQSGSENAVDLIWSWRW